MSESKQDERLLAAMLTSLDEASESKVPQAHPDEETLALFAAGALDGVERDTLVEHLDYCVACRKAAGALLMLPDDEQVTVETTRRFWRAPVGVAWFALAASLLLAVGLLWRTRSHDPQLAERETYRQVAALLVAGNFDQATRAVSRAEEGGAVSDRLKSLRAEATRGIPDPLALAYAGRLSDFGYEPGGIAARTAENATIGKGVKPALEELQQAGSSDAEVLLNRGHALLTLGRLREGLAEFDTAVKLSPANALAWLGRGMANFMLDDFGAAAEDFRQSLELDPKNIAAKMNLAMALDELGEHSEALATWRSLPGEPLSDTDRKLVERALQELTNE